MPTRREFLGSLACASTSGVIVDHAWAQTYPSRPIKMIVPFPPGGPTDAIGRVIAEGMRASLGQPVIVENVGGASGSLGTGQVARATPNRADAPIYVRCFPRHRSIAEAAIYVALDRYPSNLVFNETELAGRKPAAVFCYDKR